LRVGPARHPELPGKLRHLRHLQSPPVRPGLSSRRTPRYPSVPGALSGTAVRPVGTQRPTDWTLGSTGTIASTTYWRPSKSLSSYLSQAIPLLRARSVSIATGTSSSRQYPFGWWRHPPPICIKSTPTLKPKEVVYSPPHGYSVNRGSIRAALSKTSSDSPVIPISTSLVWIVAPCRSKTPPSHSEFPNISSTN